mmetsp:Transcript_10143/g.13406  ORF Transcript_10143/g.13406 Transcript_10143/m.13406 type:complete len:565 (-) Transcript_10143:172-1866(-)
MLSRFITVSTLLCDLFFINLSDGFTTKFIPSSRSKLFEPLHDNNGREQEGKVRLIGSIPDLDLAIETLNRKGFQVVQDETSKSLFSYRWSPAAGMLQLVPETSQQLDDPSVSAPRWIPVVQDQENVFVKNGWAFLDTDESEALSAFDVDAANLEGLYKPKWGEEQNKSTRNSVLSSIGFSLGPMSAEQIQEQARALCDDLSREVLLQGKTDPPGRKQTNNGYDFSGSINNVADGIFCCAIGDSPLFTTAYLSVSTATSGWLSFAASVEGHILHIQPDPGSMDQRIEVICAKSKCHLGHYFGREEGYCINASVLNFIPAVQDQSGTGQAAVDPIVSYRMWETIDTSSPSMRLLDTCLSYQRQQYSLVLGGGCFWHIEHALRRLPGVIETRAGYAGGTIMDPTYEQVCEGNTGHAETVLINFDPAILGPRTLVDCFLALHDPTKVRAQGKHAAGTGQYRSCIFVPMNTKKELNQIVQAALDSCQSQLGKDLSTEWSVMSTGDQDWFWEAEERHQRHEERSSVEKSRNLSTLMPQQWLELYGRRSDSILGGSPETLEEDIAQMRFMI